MYKLNQKLRTKVPVFGLRPGTRLQVMSPRDANVATHVRAKVLDTRENIVRNFSLGTVTPVSRGRPRKDGTPARARARVQHFDAFTPGFGFGEGESTFEQLEDGTFAVL